MTKPAQKVVAKKTAPKKREPARSEEDWKKQEREERQAERPTDEVSTALGSPIFLSPYSAPEWTQPRTGKRLTVSRWYPHLKVAVDFPRTEADEHEKRAFFDGRGVKAIIVPLGGSLNVSELAKLAAV